MGMGIPSMRKGEVGQNRGFMNGKLGKNNRQRPKKMHGFQSRDEEKVGEDSMLAALQ